MNHHLIWPKQRDHKKDIQDVLLFCKDKGFYFQHFGLAPDPINDNNKYVKYQIRRVSTDGDEFTYCLMEAFIDEDDCDCYRVLFDIPIDYYDLQTNLVEALRKECAEYNI